MSTSSVSDVLSNLNDQIANAARIVGRSKARQAVFEAIYSNQKQIKTIEEIHAITGLSNVHILNEGKKMEGLLIDKVPKGYRKRKEFSTRYKQILSFAKDQRKLTKIPTKISPNSPASVIVKFPIPAQNAKHITVDEINSFAKVKNQAPVSFRPIAEEKIKQGVAAVIGEKYTAKDWGGERSDLYSTRVRIGAKRLSLAIAFKGKGTKGKLVPKKMGKNGDQINRLFSEPAQVFLVVYCGEIDSSIISQMQAFAVAEALKGKKIYYGVIDGTDLGRLMAAYPKSFKTL